MNLPLLDKQLKAVAPVEGISIGQLTDKSTWRIHYRAGVTSGERAAADAVVAAFDPTLAPPTIDLSSVDNLEKNLKALALCVAQVGGLTVPQMKTLFKQKWDSLP